MNTINSFQRMRRMIYHGTVSSIVLYRSLLMPVTSAVVVMSATAVAAAASRSNRSNRDAIMADYTHVRTYFVRNSNYDVMARFSKYQPHPQNTGALETTCPQPQKQCTRRLGWGLTAVHHWFAHHDAPASVPVS